MRILVTGATGYVGGRLVPRLLEAGHEVRVLARHPEHIHDRSWGGQVEVCEGDLLEPETLEAAAAGVEAAYYLVHSMGGGGDFAERDRRAARNFVRAFAGVRRAVYLGGLLPPAEEVSEHLRSRAEVGEILGDGLPLTEFRAGPIIGSGSASFEMVRYLTERLPVMVTPRWVSNEVQPIGVEDVLTYLVLALERPPLGVVDIGGERIAFRGMMEGYAAARGLRRVIIPVPVLAPRLAALWVGLVTPIPNRLAVPLVAGIVTPVVADTTRARKHFPEVRPAAYADAVAAAVQQTEEDAVSTRWSGALGTEAPRVLTDREGLIREERTVHVDAVPRDVFRSFASLGGKEGWLVWDWAWELRGLLDRLAGGPGLRRGRRHPTELLTGEALDFWRVERVEPGRLLLLRAEMRVPGAAWLQWEVQPEEGGGSRLVQTALFAPTGAWGALYWYALYPLHGRIFSDMVRGIARRAERAEWPERAERAERAEPERPAGPRAQSSGRPT